MRTIALAALVLFCMSAAALAGAQEPAAKAPKPPATGQAPKRPALKPMTPKVSDPDDVDFWLEVSAKYLDLEARTGFMAQNANQINYVTGGDKARLIKNSQGEGVEFKKTGFIFNVLPVLNPNDESKVSMQLQVELSGPTGGLQVGSNNVPDIVSWQWQSSFTVPLGRKTVLVDGPARLELLVTRAD